MNLRKIFDIIDRGRERSKAKPPVVKVSCLDFDGIQSKITIEDVGLNLLFQCPICLEYVSIASNLVDEDWVISSNHQLTLIDGLMKPNRVI